MNTDRVERSAAISTGLIVLYLAAIVAANLIIARLGPQATIVTAFIFIGLDITTRDRLHESWRGSNLWPKMAALIAAGSLLSWIMNRDAGQIALASLAAFAASGATDAIVYHAMKDRAWLVKVNGSNVASAAIDSVIFPTLAFGELLPLIMLGQFIAKVAGGAVWAFILGLRQR
jgi:queuosine precursor transporter